MYWKIQHLQNIKAKQLAPTQFLSKKLVGFKLL